MDVCSLEEIQNLFIFYDTCFSKYFPELDFYCNEKEFPVHSIIRKYSDIKGVCYNTTHFIIEMKQEYVIYLPLSIDAKFRILTKQKTYYS